MEVDDHAEPMEQEQEEERGPHTVYVHNLFEKLKVDGARVAERAAH